MKVAVNYVNRLIKIAICLSLLLGVNTVYAAIADTKHNLGSTGTQANSFSGTEAICVFCHTPHGADTTASVPLWNRVLSDPGIYTTYDSLGTSTLDGAIAPIGSVSIACLSCHDGTQAMNVMINAPGSGGYDPAGAILAGTWTGVGQLNDPAAITTIGTDLTNDHPIGIQYGGGGVNATTHATDGLFAGTTNDADFNAPYRSTINATPMWWVDTVGGTAGVREKTDMALYTRTEASVAGGTQPFVECASCHNPHESVNPTFLRLANTGSSVCLACHIK